MTVLPVVAFFALFISLDYVMSRRRLAREARAHAIANIPALEPAWVAGYQMPESLYYHRGHTWARPLDADTVLVGIDDFARKLIGAPASVRVPSRGDWLHQGGRAFARQARRQGRRARLARRGRGGRGQPRRAREARARRRRPLRQGLGDEGQGAEPRLEPAQPALRPHRPQVDGGQPRGPRAAADGASPAPCCRTAASPPPTSATTSPRVTGTASSTSSS